MSRITTALAALTLAGAATASLAGPAMASQHDSLWWDHQTTTAYHAYERHPSPCRFAVMARDATRADAYLSVDIGIWARDRARHAPAKVLAADAWYAWADATMTADQAASQ